MLLSDSRCKPALHNPAQAGASSLSFTSPPVLQIPIVLAPIWLLYGYATPVLDEYVAGLSSSDSAAVDKARCALVSLLPPLYLVHAASTKAI